MKIKHSSSNFVSYKLIKILHSLGNEGKRKKTQPESLQCAGIVDIMKRVDAKTKSQVFLSVLSVASFAIRGLNDLYG